VEALRAFHDAETLAGFAARWSRDQRPAARRFLLEYLDRPLNAFRHEPLIKRLFKHAEAAGDDELMARFLVLFDRSMRREEYRRTHYEGHTARTPAEAEALVARWQSLGYENIDSWPDARGQVRVYGRWYEPGLRTPFGTTMPRDKGFGKLLDGAAIPARTRQRFARLRLFSAATRHYLRRRAWRYFRRLGRTDPGRYLRAVSLAVVRYADEDVSSGLALIDNWGLIHILFHRSPVLMARPAGWVPAEGRTLGELTPAPIYQALWENEPRAIVDVLIAASCRPVRQWAIQMIRRHDTARATIRLDELLTLLGHEDPDVVAFAAECLKEAKGLEDLDLPRWLELVETASPASLPTFVEVMRLHVDAQRPTLEQAVRLAMSRPLPLARLGLEWLGTKVPRNEAECRMLLTLADAECAPVRPEIVRHVVQRLAGSPHFEPGWVLELLDSRHEDSRAEGFAWFRTEPRAGDDVALWSRLLESPHDDVRLALVAQLEARVKGRDEERLAALDFGPEALRLLWASVLLNVHRGSGAKPRVVRQLVRWIERRPEDAAALLPLLAVALRSSRGPERRAGLAAVAALVARREEVAGLLTASVPELKLL
jgi:hypothetical protein